MVVVVGNDRSQSATAREQLFSAGYELMGFDQTTLANPPTEAGRTTVSHRTTSVIRLPFHLTTTSAAA